MLTFLQGVAQVAAGCSGRSELKFTRLSGEYVSCFEDMVLKKGRRFNQPEKVSEMPGQMKECFMNAFKYLIAFEDVIYCEGYAHSGLIPVHHAWLVNSEGTVIDPTWGKDGLEYFGIPFKRKFVIKTVCSSGYYGVIDNWKERHPLMRKFPDDIVEPMEFEIKELA